MPLYDFACDACEHEFEARAEPGETATCLACGVGARPAGSTRPIAPPAKLGLRGAAAQRVGRAARGAARPSGAASSAVARQP